MRYLGGKTRLAKEIVPHLPIRDRELIWEPFCGGCSVSVEIVKAGARNLICSDVCVCVPLITMYQALQKGWLPPTEVTPENHQTAKTLPDSDPRKAFVGFGCSFGGKWFGGYARSRGRNHARKSADNCTDAFAIINGGVNYADLSSRVVLRQSVVLFEIRDFNCTPPIAKLAPRMLIYCDPPYASTTGYKAVDGFDHGVFWARCREWAKAGALVYVSEFSAPPFAKEIWSKDRYMSVCKNAKSDRRVEKLFEVKP